jgi:short-subunit dehydrogenase
MTPGWWMPAEAVVAESLRGLKRGKLIVIPGMRYRMLVAAAKFFPRALIIKAASRRSLGRGRASQ